MGFFRNMIRTGIGTAGKLLGGFANHMTGGLAGKVGGEILNAATKHAGVIGKVAQGIGRTILSDDARNALSKVADSAMKLIPDGKVKNALRSINDSAQGRNEMHTSAPNKYKSSSSRSTASSGTVYGESTAPIQPFKRVNETPSYASFTTRTRRRKKK